VFDGLFVGNLDAGTTSFDGRFSSGVCAAKARTAAGALQSRTRDCDDPSLKRRRNLCQTSTGKAQN
jgi:hypothetical protein